MAANVWDLILDRLGLERRRVYQTCHTAAVLHLAAGENPLFVSRLLGHSLTKMLFERYALFVANALADDGVAVRADDGLGRGWLRPTGHRTHSAPAEREFGWPKQPGRGGEA